MEMTEEQRKRAEANRAAAIAKRKAFLESTAAQQRDPWHLFKCQKFSHPQPSLPKPHKFLARLEICSPDSFSVTPLPLPNFPFPSPQTCFHTLNSILSHVVPSHFTQTSAGEKACVFKLADYGAVSKRLKAASAEVQVEEIPWGTLNVVERLSHSSAAGRWTPVRPEHLSDDEVDRLIGKLPRTLLDALLPFQLDGLRFALRRGGRSLIADDMGLGKTLQDVSWMKGLYLLFALLFCGFLGLKNWSGGFLSACPLTSIWFLAIKTILYIYQDALELWLFLIRCFIV